MGAISNINGSFYLGNNLSLRSGTTGRERWEIKGLYRKKFLAEALEQELRSKQNLTEVSVNPLTGRALILFDPAFYTEGVRCLIEQALQHIFRQHGNVFLLSDDLPDIAATSGAPLDRKTLFALIESVDGEKAHRREALTLSVLNTTFKITTPLLQGMIMACGLQGGFVLLSGFGLSFIPQIALLGAGYYTSASLEKYLEYKRKQKWTEYSTVVEAALRERSYQHIHSLSLQSMTEEEWGPTELVNFVKDDTQQVKKFLEYSAPSLIDKSLTFSACSVLLLAVSPTAFVLAMIPLPFMYRMSGKFNRESRKRHQDVEIRQQELSRTIKNNIHGLPTVKSYTAEAWEQERLSAVGEAYDNSYGNAAKERYKYYGKLQFGVYLGISMPVIYSTYCVYQQTLSVATFSGIAFLLPQMILSTQGIDQDYAFYQSGASAAKRLRKLLDVVPEDFSGERLSLDNVKGEIRFENVSFRYAKPWVKTASATPMLEPEIILKNEQENSLVLDRLTLTIPAGSTTAFVGGTGSGKSTLIKLLLRFYEPTTGRILLDGKDIRTIDLVDLRRALGWVSQDVYLFEGSIADNIRYGATGATIEEVATAAELASAKEFIEAKPNGFNEKVGEQGQLLSGGQRQRLSIARALLKDSPILMLDEATSAVDNLTESKIHKAIMSKHEDRTLLIVAHRLSTVAKANCIYLLENGKIRESGTHEQLLANEGQYAQLWRLQLNISEQEDECEWTEVI